MTQAEKAKRFAGLHVKGTPLLLYNAWDAGSAKAIAEAGAQAIATSSWAVAAAQGYPDGEAVPFDLVEQIVAQITVTIDFEGGYSEEDDELADYVARLLDLGVIGINFEDRVVQGSGLYKADRQAQRIQAIREEADRKDVALFINARTDVFFGGGSADPAQEVLDRAKAYADAGASGLFVPGLQDEADIKRICDAISLPLNIMVMDGVPSTKRLTELGVSRISYGPIPYVRAMTMVHESARETLS
jgi:2-methylisocitrate lyase-like PEP mutase family enzyme